jgi:hypothetical protein
MCRVAQRQWVSLRWVTVSNFVPHPAQKQALL